MKNIFSYKQSILLSIILLFGSAANAAIINIFEIRITPSALNTEGWLQVSEVVATETGTGNDLALASAGATAVGSSDWPGSSPANAIDGIGPIGFPDIFHSNENDGSSFLSVKLASASSLDSVSIFGRTDACCSQRDYYDIALFDINGNQLFSATDLDGTNGSVTSNLNAVPLPAAVWLLGSGFLSLMVMGRRKS